MAAPASSPEVLLAIEVQEYRLGGNIILSNLSLEFRPGMLTVIVGPNGAGKSTLLAALAGDVAECRHHVKLTGQPLTHWKARPLARQRAVMTQDHSVRFAFSVEEVVTMGRLPHPPDPTSDQAIVNEAMTCTDIVHLKSRNVQTLSGGEGSRSAFARVLAQTTHVLLLDEPTAALDLRHQEKLLQELATLANRGVCVIVVLHDLNLAAAYADRIIMMARGQVMADGDPRQVLREETIEKVYQQRVLVIDHPTRRVPLVVCDGAVRTQPNQR